MDKKSNKPVGTIKVSEYQVKGAGPCSCKAGRGYCGDTR